MNFKPYCICLPEYPEATESAKAHFSEVGLENVEFFWGFNAPLAGVATTHTYEVDHPGSGYKMGAKPTGIWLSHYMLWSHLMRQPEEHFMVLETDAQFAPNWKERLERAWNDVPSNFDFLYPGYCCMENHERKHIRGDVWETKHSQCTHCYIVRRGILPHVLSSMRKVWAPIDCQLVMEIFPTTNVYATIPRMVAQFNTIIPP